VCGSFGGLLQNKSWFGIFRNGFGLRGRHAWDLSTKKLIGVALAFIQRLGPRIRLCIGVFRRSNDSALSPHDRLIHAALRCADVPPNGGSKTGGRKTVLSVSSCARTGQIRPGCWRRASAAAWLDPARKSCCPQMMAVGGVIKVPVKSRAALRGPCGSYHSDGSHQRRVTNRPCARKRRQRRVGALDLQRNSANGPLGSNNGEWPATKDGQPMVRQRRSCRYRRRDWGCSGSRPWNVEGGTESVKAFWCADRQVTGNDKRKNRRCRPSV